ncbi:MAG TPA: nicotinate (nicotinamide) nucleotide adenylyltransferase [Candidatus Marinimicrobia bacterium]|nr:nicotinate (nicotinamide) nucleotide adenylyltransferase [Candidatus Neomarinimicrobiota bacterium]
MKRICLFGGTFDPVHKGHIALAEAVCQAYNISRFIFIPARVAPHKEGSDSAAPWHRLEMLRLATKGKPLFEISDMELQREGISYTIDTITSFQKEYPASDIRWFYLIGSDNLLIFKSWRNWSELLKKLEFLVAPRKGFPIEEAESDILEKMIVLDTPYLDVSATKLRNHLALLKSQWLEPIVAEYILNQKLYR